MRTENANNLETRYIVSNRKDVINHISTKRNSAFTLVELIIVITILAILATIGFMSFQSYTIDARDGKRVTDLGTIRSGLEIYQTKKTTLPDPDPQTINIMSGELLISIQGYMGAIAQKSIRMTDEVKDTDSIYYTYSVNSDKTKYELLAMLESQENLAMKNNLLNETYAGYDYNSKHPYAIGKYVVFFTGTTNTPLQANQITQTGELNLALVSTQIKAIISGTGTTIFTGSALPEIVNRVTSAVVVVNNTVTTVNATCGSANGITVATIPTTNLCGDSTLPTVSGTGPWTWTCIGTGSPIGTNASCSANKTLAVGDIVVSSGSEIARYAGVYTGGHGKTLWVAGTEATSLAWKDTATTTLNAISMTDGRLNSGTLNANHPASNYCQNLVWVGYSDWYLPAQSATYGQTTSCFTRNGEMQFLYCQHKGTGSQALLGFGNNWYWSSTEYDTTNARLLNFSNAIRSLVDKTFSLVYVRCVRVAD